MPVLVVDGTFLMGKYSQTLLMACSFDGNHNIFTVAFTIVDKESIDSWVWFFDCIQQLVTERENICIISYRHAGIRHSMEKIQRGCVWRWCSRHYESNHNSVVKDPNMKERLKSIVNEGCRWRFNAKVVDFLEVDQRLRINKPNWVVADQVLWSK
ncbi:hypothetical protein LINGRAHAP2_LOCUS9256, partial [Linum grandiflorum]